MDDRSAADFSERFFRSLAAGKTFEVACADARTKVFRAFPENSSWAQYQAWGDPDYKLEDLKLGP